VRRSASREEVRQLLAQGAQIVEVLPPEEYAEAHIAGSISIPLEEIRTRANELNPNIAVVAYCNDFQ
jgi:rhodanese-related sulfurtransferase